MEFCITAGPPWNGQTIPFSSVDQKSLESSNSGRTILFFTIITLKRTKKTFVTWDTRGQTNLSVLDKLDLLVKGEK
jgi:hypothetical protein